MNTCGRRLEGPRHDELRVRVFPGGHSMFTLYEDDGATIAYQRGELRTTEITQTTTATSLTVTIAAAHGNYRNAPGRRAAIVEIAGVQPKSVTLDDARASWTAQPGTIPIPPP